MKIIHTYLPLVGKTIDKRNLYQLVLSLLSAKKFYDDVVLYTNKETAEIIRTIGLPYTYIDDTLLNDVHTGTFSVPKMLVYSVQKEPFIHIDLDTFIFEKIPFNKINGIYSAFNEGHNLMLSMDHNGFGFFDSYIENTFKLRDKLPKEFMKHIKFHEIPNMCIFGGFNYQIIAEATKYCLDIYENNREFFDSYYYNACIIEQLFIPAAIRMIAEKNQINFDYDIDSYFIRKNNENEKKINFVFLFDIVPTTLTILNFTPGKEWEYPFEINSRNESVLVENELDLYDKITYEFNGFMHLCGYKKSDSLMYLVRSKIIFKYGGSNYLKKMDEIYEQTFEFEKNVEHYELMKKLLNKKKPLF